MEYDLIIRDTTIVDGSGRPAFNGSVGVQGDSIAAVGEIEGNAAREIDGSGLVTCPGFIDSHSHADMSILQYPLAESLVMQGITTFLGGNCGMCLAPLKDPGNDPALRKRYGDLVDRMDWRTFDEWLSVVEREEISVNYAPLVGHISVRTAVMGQDFRRQATRDEIKEMKVYVKAGMESGGFGLSSLFDPGPAEWATLDEVVELAKVTRKHGGIYTPHTRFHQDSWVTDDRDEHGYGLMHAPRGEVIAGRYHGLLEAVEVAKKADIRLLIAHFTPAYIIPQPQPRLLQEAAAKASLIDIVDKPRQEGVDVFYNVIAYTPSIGGEVSLMGSFLDPYHRNLPLPEWMKALTQEEFVQGLKTRAFRDKVTEVFYSGRIKFFMMHPLINPYWMDCFTIVRCRNKEYEGKTVGEIARQRSSAFIRDIVYHVSLETVFDIIIEDPETTWAVSTDVRENPAALSVFLQHPCGIPCTDTRSLPAELPEDRPERMPPIAYGLFPHYIKKYVTEERVLSLEEAVRKATSLPAEVLGLSDRGTLATEAYADIVVFDLNEMEMRGDFAPPSRPPGGIRHVLVNGQVVYENMTHQGVRSGRVLRRGSGA
jgi:N-acyl-D-aspartate/D-glutamate deacylase